MATRRDSTINDPAQEATSFLGLDVAWKTDRNSTGLAAFRLEGKDIRPAGLASGVYSLDKVIQFVKEMQSPSTVIAIDAPLIVANQTGQRPCETAITKRFHAQAASAHSANLTINPDSIELARRLQAMGYRHCVPPTAPRSAPGKWMFEVYPHPAHVRLFGLERTIRYKKGPLEDRRAGLIEYLEALRGNVIKDWVAREHQGSIMGALQKSAADLAALNGRDLKAYEDLLDAVFSAYLAFYLWRWGWTGNEFVGDTASGYIVLPMS